MGGVGGGIREDSPYPDWAAGATLQQDLNSDRKVFALWRYNYDCLTGFSTREEASSSALIASVCSWVLRSTVSWDIGL